MMVFMLKKTLADDAVAATVREELERHRGFQTDRPEVAPAPFSTVEVELVGAGGSLGRASGQVVHISQQGDVAVAFDEDASHRLLMACRPERLAKMSRSKASERGRGQPMWVHYDKLDKPEKIRLARTGAADARAAVMRDRDPSLHVHMLDNPGLTGNELAALVRANTLATPALKRIAERNDLLSNPSVLDAIVQNPRTPMELAARLVSRLPLDTVRRISRQAKLRQVIVAAARRRVMKR